MQQRARQEARLREEVVGLLHVAVAEHVLPGHQHLVHDEDRVVLVDAGGQRVVEGAAHHGRGHLVGRPADQLHAGRAGRDHEDGGKALVADGDQAVVGHERVVGERRARRHHLGAGHDDAGVGLLLHVAVDVADLLGRAVAIDGGMDDGVVDERHALLAELVPALGVLLPGIVEVGIGAERAEEGRLVVGRAAEPAVAEPSPLGDGVAAGDRLLDSLRALEIGVRHAAVAGVGRHQQLVLVLGIVQRVVEARDHARGVAEGWMRRDVLDALAVDVDLAVVAQQLQELIARHRLGGPDLAGGLGPLGERNLGLRLATSLVLPFRASPRKTRASRRQLFDCARLSIGPVDWRRQTIGARLEHDKRQEPRAAGRFPPFAGRRCDGRR